MSDNQLETAMITGLVETAAVHHKAFSATKG